MSRSLLAVDAHVAGPVAAAAGRSAREAWSWRTAALPSGLPGCGERECFYRGRRGDDGVRVLDDQDSGVQKGLAAADLLIRRRPGARALSAGELVEVLPF